MVRMVVVFDLGQDRFETGSSVFVVRGEVSSAKEHTTLGRKEGGQRPASLSRDRADRHLVSAVKVWTFVAVHFDRNKMFVNKLGDVRILIALSVHHVTPVAPDRSDVEKDRPVEFLGF